MLSVVVTTIVAAAVGAVASLAVNAVQWRRDDKLKWDPERRIAYERFVTSIDRWEELDHHAAVKGELEEWFDAPLDDRLEPLTGVYESSRLRPRVNAAASEARSRLAELELIGSPAVTNQARALTEAMHCLCCVRYTSPPRDCGGASEPLNIAVDRYNIARSEYVNAVRAELGTN